MLFSTVEDWIGLVPYLKKSGAQSLVVTDHGAVWRLHVPAMCACYFDTHDRYEWECKHTGTGSISPHKFTITEVAKEIKMHPKI